MLLCPNEIVPVGGYSGWDPWVGSITLEFKVVFALFHFGYSDA